MSSRVLKKLQGGRDADLKAKSALIDEELSDEDKDDIERCRSNLNSFDLLNQSLSESEFKEDDNETEHASAATNVPTVSGAAKKKKKKRRKKTKHTGNHISSEDNEIAEKYLNELDDMPAKVSGLTIDVTARNKPDKSLLQVELKNLNSQNELRRTFGKRVVKIENKRGRQKLTLKTTYMVTAKESWPPATKNLITMKPLNGEQISTAAGTSSSSGSDIASSSTSPTTNDKTFSFLPDTKEQWFTFEHSQQYQCIQKMFYSQVSEAEYLMDLILRYPYHVDSLIQLNELCRLTEDYSLGADFIERAVFVMEHSLHSSFSLTSGTSRLDYRRQENRAFFIVLFKHAVYLEERACSRTALELAKLILTFSPSHDPLAIVLIIDYFAMRSKQYSWLVRFYEEYDSVRNLSQLPNMAYSYALALFCLAEDQKCENTEMLQKADKALQYALLMFPSILRKLLDVLSIQTDKRVLSCSYFNSDDSRSAEGLNMLVNYYVRRAKVIWRQANMLPWMERNVHIVIDRVERDDPVVIEYRLKRATRYMSPPLAISRHLVLSGEKLPQRIIESLPKRALAPYDPLPPLDSFNCYESCVNKSSSSSPSNASNRAFSIFFESVLPSFSFQPQNAQADVIPVQNINRNANANEQEQARQRGEAHDGEAQGNNMQALNANIQNELAEGAAGNPENVASYRVWLDAIRNRFRDVLLTGDNADNAEDTNENRSSEEEIVVYLDDSSD